MPDRVYSLQFKDEACKLAVSPDYGVARAARELGVSEPSMRSWMKQRKLLPQSQPATEVPQSDDINVLRLQLKEA
jgi:transposase-like protein